MTTSILPHKIKSTLLPLITLAGVIACSHAPEDQQQAVPPSAAIESMTYAQAKKICQDIGKPQFPIGDKPTPAELKDLANCSSYNLYYGINGAQNYAQARQCAFAEIAANGGYQNSFSGETALMTIYATGNGVKPNLHLALQLACDQLNQPDLGSAQKADITNWVGWLSSSGDGVAIKDFTLCSNPHDYNLKLDCNNLAFDLQCKKLATLPYPSVDMPDAVTKKSLQGCDSDKLYYGIGMKVDYVKARQCAFSELKSVNSVDANFFSGATILMMIYANGQGVAKNIDLALKSACQVGGAEAETAGRFDHLNKLRKVNARAPFDVCDDITSGEMQSVCSDNAYQYHQAQMNSELVNLTRGWSESAITDFKALLVARDKYFTAAAENEISNQGTAAASLQIERQRQLESDFQLDIQQFQQGKLPHHNAEDYATSDQQLNQLYLRIIHSQELADPDLNSGIDKAELIKTQKIWLKYRDQWIKFGVMHYIGSESSDWSSWQTQERIKDLQQLQQYLGIK